MFLGWSDWEKGVYENVQRKAVYIQTCIYHESTLEKALT
jgi:hypothetical protein